MCAAEQDRRNSERVRFSWPIWFGYDPSGELHRGKVVDLSDQGVCFSLPKNDCPQVGNHVLTRFSYPVLEKDEFQMGSYYQWSQVIRIDTEGDKCKVALRLHESLGDKLPLGENLPIMV